MSHPPGAVKVPASGSFPALILITCAVWLLRGYLWPLLSNVEVDTLRAMLDPELFRRDFAVQECLGFSPRYYYNVLILLPARAGLPLEWVFALWQLVAIGTLLSGVRALARTAGLGEPATAVLILWLLTIGIGTLGGVYFYTHAPVPAVWAGAAVTWGAAWVWRGRWLAAFVCFGVAALLQFLVGFYAGVLAVPALLWTRRWRGLPLLAPWLLGLALVYVPMTLTDGTGTQLFDDTSYVQVYAQLRVPHHLVPSTWAWPHWAQAAAFYAGAAWFLHRARARRPRGETALLFGSIGLAAAALLLNYVFVEIHPLALVAKLQPARITPLTQGLILLLLATRMHARFAQRDWLGGVLLCLIPFTAFPGLLLILAAVLTPATGTQPPPAWSRYILALAVLIAFQPFGWSMLARSSRYAVWAALVGTHLLAFALVRRPYVLASLAVLGAAGTLACAYASQTAAWPGILAGRFSINFPPNDPPGIIGRRFGLVSMKDVLVLVPPTSEVWTFKLHSRRAVVVDDKGTPFTDRGLREWRDRMEQVLGTALVPGLDAAAAWRARSAEAVAATARKYGARYILTTDESHPALPGTPIDHEAGWTLWQLPPTTPPADPGSK